MQEIFIKLVMGTKSKAKKSKSHHVELGHFITLVRI